MVRRRWATPAPAASQETANDGGGAAKETLGASPEAITWWLRKALRTQGEYGKFVVPGGGQPVITTVRSLRRAGGAAFAALSVYECVESGLD